MDMSCQRSMAFSSSTTQQANQENMFSLPLLFECKCFSVQCWLLIYAVTVRIVSIQTQNKSTAAKCYLASHQCAILLLSAQLCISPVFGNYLAQYYMQLVHFTKVHFTKDKLPHLRKHFQLPLYILLCYMDILYVIM